MLKKQENIKTSIPKISCEKTRPRFMSYHQICDYGEELRQVFKQKKDELKDKDSAKLYMYFTELFRDLKKNVGRISDLNADLLDSDLKAHNDAVININDKRTERCKVYTDNVYSKAKREESYHDEIDKIIYETK